MLFKIGERTGKTFPCRITRFLASGGMSEIYLAQLEGTKHFFAVKAVDNSEKKVRCLKKEYELLKKLRWSGIPRVMIFEEEKRRSYFVMFYYEGINLEQYIEDCLRKGEKIPEHKILHIAKGLCQILAYLHGDVYDLQRVKQPALIHQDIKPANILLQENNRVVLLDFGVADYGGAVQNNVAFQGTLGYAAPECWHREQEGISRATDIFALGATLFRLLEGREPRACFGSFVLTDKERAARWQEIINKCCAMDKNDRIQSAAKLYEMLKQHSQYDK